LTLTHVTADTVVRAVWRTEYVNCHMWKIERQHKPSGLQNCYASFVQSP